MDFRRAILLSITIFYCVVAYSNEKYDIEVDTTYYIFNGTEFRNYRITITNKSDATIWMIFDDSKEIDSCKRLRKFLLKKKGDFSLLDIVSDPNYVFRKYGKYNIPIFHNTNNATKDILYLCVR